jgi:hypothetical protein
MSIDQITQRKREAEHSRGTSPSPNVEPLGDYATMVFQASQALAKLVHLISWDEMVVGSRKYQHVRLD